MEFNYYKAKIKSDTGIHFLYVSSTSESDASLLIQTANSCPANAIKSIKIVTKEKFMNRNRIK
jgi:hypothetical protein